MKVAKVSNGSTAVLVGSSGTVVAAVVAAQHVWINAGGKVRSGNLRPLSFLVESNFDFSVSQLSDITEKRIRGELRPTDELHG